MKSPVAKRLPLRLRVFTGWACLGLGLSGSVAAGPLQWNALPFHGTASSPSAVPQMSAQAAPARAPKVAGPQQDIEPPPPQVPSTAPTGTWEVRLQDITLHQTLQRWARDAGVRVQWDAPRHVLIGAPDRYQGSFEDALQAVLGSAGIRDSDFPLEACVYANQPPLVRITRQGEQRQECTTR